MRTLCPPTVGKSPAELLATVRLEATPTESTALPFRVSLAPDDEQEVRLVS